ncbi:MAG: SulP family inorganic anion transporter [Pseudomonadales bacterium]|nr:SulP family inorganic anion transporter [Pseudomonadales bacterium]
MFNEFNLKNLKGDLFGGLSAAIVALPLGLAFGVSSGVGPIAGIYSAIIVGFFAAVFGGTPAQISGPTGPMTVVMAGVVTSYLAQDPENGLINAFTVVVMAGFFQVLFGLLKLGKYVVQVSYPVISGFMSGIGVIIIVLQLRPLVGLPPVPDPLSAILDIPNLFTEMDKPTVILGVIALVVAFTWKGRVNNWIPSPVLLLVVGTLMVLFVPQFSDISTLGVIPMGLPEFSMPVLVMANLVDDIGVALLLATLGSIDSLLTSLVADNVTQTQHNSDKELIGQGIGNMAAGLFGAIPGAGATIRTVVNVKAGGLTALSGVVHSVLITAVILGAGSLAGNIPNVILAAILIKVGVDIVDQRFLKKITRIPLFSAGLMLSVLLLTVFVDLITAVFIGVFIANMVTVERLTGVQLDNVKFFERNDGHLDRFSESISAQFDNPALLELRGPMSFGVARGINRRLAESKGHDVLVIDLSEAQLLGITSALAVLDIIQDERLKGRAVKLALNPDEATNEVLRKVGVFESIAAEDIIKLAS